MKYIIIITEDIDDILTAEELGKLNTHLLSKGKILTLDAVVHDSMYFSITDA